MSSIFSIAKKEMSSYFKSPTAYIVLVLMISIFNLFFFIIVDQNREVSLNDVFLVMGFMMVFLAPIITMRLFAEEKMAGTMEFLMTAPVSNTAIVLGKYLAVLALFSIMFFITLLYYFIVEFFGEPDRLTTAVGYLGVWLEGALFLSIGLMASSWTRNQIVAAMISLALMFLLYFSASITPFFTGSIGVLFENMSALKHLENFVSGSFTVSDFSYYLSGVFVCLLITRVSIENRNLKEVFRK